jgi:cystathionine beta-lyase
VSPSKAFNLAGLQIATIVCANEEVRNKIDRAINDNEVCDVNPFGVIATQAAYNEGEEWLQELIVYLHENYRFMQEYCEEHLPEFPVATLEGTYLAWMDCRALNIPSEALEERLLEESRLWLNAGTMYGAEGEGFMRWNLACTRSTLTEALERFRKFVRG